jgi:hypothetical protein
MPFITRKSGKNRFVGQYRHLKLDLIVIVGPNPILLLAEPNAIFPNVPVVFCCGALGQIDQIRGDHRSTGTWFQLEPAKTVEAALGLLPETHHLFVVGGQSDYDRDLTALGPYPHHSAPAATSTAKSSAHGALWIRH